MKTGKILTIFLSLSLFFSSLGFVSCKVSPDEIIYLPPTLWAETFSPTEASDLDVEIFKGDYLKSKYHYDMAVEFTGTIYNYMPTSYASKYKIGAFEVVQGNKSNYYIWHDGVIFNVDRIGANHTATSRGFVQFLIADMNCDGHFELVTSYYLNNNLEITYLSAYDSATQKSAEAAGIYNECAFFKREGSGWAIYTAEDNNTENAKKKYSEIIPNAWYYSFLGNSYRVATSDYMADITIDEHTINFPILFKNLQISFKVKTVMTWLGESFSYQNGNGYLDGAWVMFNDGTNELNADAIAATDVITTFCILNGYQITCDYQYSADLENRNEISVYDMKVGYRFSEEKAIAEDFLTICKVWDKVS